MPLGNSVRSQRKDHEFVPLFCNVLTISLHSVHHEPEGVEVGRHRGWQLGASSQVDRRNRDDVFFATLEALRVVLELFTRLTLPCGSCFYVSQTLRHGWCGLPLDIGGHHIKQAMKQLQQPKQR